MPTSALANPRRGGFETRPRPCINNACTTPCSDMSRRTGDTRYPWWGERGGHAPHLKSPTGRHTPSTVFPDSDRGPSLLPPLPAGEGWGEGQATTHSLDLPDLIRYPGWGERGGHAPHLQSPTGRHTPSTVFPDSDRGPPLLPPLPAGEGWGKGITTTPFIDLPPIVAPHSDAGPVPRVGRGGGRQLCAARRISSY